MASPVASTPNAVAAALAVIEPAPARDATSVDFATLLQGRLDVGKPTLLAASASAKEDSTSDKPASDAVTDAAALFAALNTPAAAATPPAALAQMIQAPAAQLPAVGTASTDKTDGPPATATPTLPSNASPAAVAALQSAPGQIMLRAGTADGQPGAPAIEHAQAKLGSANAEAAASTGKTIPDTAEAAASQPASFAALAAGARKSETTQPGDAPLRPRDPAATDVSTAVPLAVAQHPQAANRAPDASMGIDTPLRHPSWHADFSQQIVWMASNHIQKAELSLNPANLGPIQIQLSLAGDQGTAVFMSPHAEVREAVEAALPRLREMFADAGIQLGQASVSAESFRNPQNNGGEPPRFGRADAILGADSGSAGSVVDTALRRGSGLVDTFA